MAQLTQTPEERRRIDRLLDHCEARWSDLPVMARRFADWDDSEQTAFVFEWSIPENNLRKLEDFSSRGLMNEAQQGRFADLRRLASENRPIIEGLRKEKGF